MSDLLPWESMAKVANNLIDKGDKMIDRLSNFFVWCVNHDTPNRIALDTYISDIQNSDMDPLTKAALISNARKTIREYKNQCNIVAIAMENLKSDAQPDKVDEDWLAQFMDKARLVNNAELQQWWGRILAGECNSPGSVPKTLLHILEQMDVDSASGFMAVANFAVAVETKNGDMDYQPLIIIKKINDFYEHYGVTIDVLVDLQALGLISFDLISAFAWNVKDIKNGSVMYHDQKYDINMDKRQLPTGNVIFSKGGASLCSIITREKNEDFFEKVCVPHWESANRK